MLLRRWQLALHFSVVEPKHLHLACSVNRNALSVYFTILKAGNLDTLLWHDANDPSIESSIRKHFSLTVAVIMLVVLPRPELPLRCIGTMSVVRLVERDMALCDGLCETVMSFF